MSYSPDEGEPRTNLTLGITTTTNVGTRLALAQYALVRYALVRYATTTPHPLLPHYQEEEQTQSYNWRDNKLWAEAERDYHQALE